MKDIMMIADEAEQTAARAEAADRKVDAAIMRRGGVFDLLAVLGPSAKDYQHGAQRVRREVGGSVLVENLVGAYAERCDRLLGEFNAAFTHQTLFRPEWMSRAMSEGATAEASLVYWAGQR